MNEASATRTAVSTAMCRAVHLLLDAEPKILNDRFARALAGFDSDEALLTAFQARPQVVQDARAVFVVRSRYAEDSLAEAVERGVSQYVLVGAGLDSFGYRSRDRYPGLDVFEADLPGAGAEKRRRTAELGMEQPPSLHFVPDDLEKDSLVEALAANGWDRSRPTLFSILGVTQYLTRETNERTWLEIAEASAPGSELVVQFQAPPESLDAEGGALLRELGAKAAELGEPFLSYHTPEEMESLLRRIGFSRTERFGVQEATDRYLRGRTDSLHLPSLFSIVKATVGS